jgi:hypothetical protein
LSTIAEGILQQGRRSVSFSQGKKKIEKWKENRTAILVEIKIKIELAIRLTTQRERQKEKRSKSK